MAKSNKGNKGNKPDREDEGQEQEHDQRDIEDQLQDLNDDWGDTEEKVGGDVPPGKYQVKMTSVTINNSQSSGRLQASFEMTILNTAHRGRKLFSHFGLDDVEQRGYLRGALAKLGVEWPTKPAELPSVLEGVENTFAEVNHSLRKRKDKDSGQILDNYNTYFNRALDSAEVDDLDTEDTDTNDRDKPPKPEKPAKPSKPAASKPAAKEEDEQEAEGEGETKAETNGEVSLKFTMENLDKAKKHRTRIKQAAAKYDFDPEDYNDLIDLAGDVAEHVGLTGEFKDPEKLIAAIEAKGGGDEE